MSTWGELQDRLSVGVRRWFAEEPPGAAYAAGALPQGLERSRRLTRHYRLSGLLPYEQWDEDSGLFINDDLSMGFILEVQPATGLDRARLDVLAGLFKQDVPAGTSMQVCLYASPALAPWFDHWQRLRHGVLYATLAERRASYLGDANWASLFRDQPLLLRDFRLFISVLTPPPWGDSRDTHGEELLRLQSALLGILESANLPARALDAGTFVRLLDTMLNPGRERSTLRWQPRTLLREQAVDGDTILFVGRDGLGSARGGDHTAWVLRPAREHREQWAGWRMTDLIGDLFSNSLRLPCPFLHTMNVLFPEQSSARDKAQFNAVRATQMADSPIGRFLPVWRERQADWRFVARMSASGHRLVQAGSQLVLFVPRTQAAHAGQRLTALFDSCEWLLRADRFVALHAFLSALPLMHGCTFRRESRMLARGNTMLSWSAVNAAPWSGEWKGTSSPLLLLVGRRGQLMYFDPFDNDQGNFNLAVAAASGAGKSFFTQELLISLLGTGGRAWVIDSGRSYQRLCHLIGGSYLDFEQRRRINLNPFSGVRDFAAELPLLKSLLAQMAASREALNSLQLAHLERAIQSCWSAHGTRADVGGVAAELLRAGDESAVRVGQMLYPYTAEGVYGRYFTGAANIDLDHDLVVLELGGLDDKPDLQQVILLLLILRINREMYLGERSRRKLCIIDEAWRLMAHGNAGRFIETGYRTARKFGGAYMTVTQGLDDYYRAPTARAALQNSDWVCLLRQRPESLLEVKREGRLHMDDAMFRLLSSLETRQGKYSEIAVMAPGGGLAVGRLLVDPFSQTLYSTRAEEYAAVQRLLEQGHDLVSAIETLAAARREN